MTFEQAASAIRAEIAKTGGKWADYFTALPCRGYEAPDYVFSITGEVVPRAFHARMRIEFEGEPISAAQQQTNKLRARTDEADEPYR